MSVPVRPCPSLSVPVCPRLPLSVPAYPYIRVYVRACSCPFLPAPVHPCLPHLSLSAHVSAHCPPLSGTVRHRRQCRPFRRRPPTVCSICSSQRLQFVALIWCGCQTVTAKRPLSHDPVLVEGVSVPVLRCSSQARSASRRRRRTQRSPEGTPLGAGHSSVRPLLEEAFNLTHLSC